MCNLYTQTKSVDEIKRVFQELALPLQFPEGLPNLKPGEIRITDSAPIVRDARNASESYDLLVRRWSWPGPGGKPVYNFRSDGREFRDGRCLILADGFYEFTTPADPKQKRKDRWLFSSPDEPMLGIAGLVREIPGLGQAFTMLTTEPGPDVAPYHGRQVAVLPVTAWSAWLSHEAPASSLIKPLPPGSLEVRRANA